MNTGLSAKDTKSIIEAIKRYPIITQAKIFGSRAKGTYKNGSDIDIALYMDERNNSEACEKVMRSLHEVLEEELPLPYFFDLIDAETINNNKLKRHIERVGVPLFSVQHR